jgi:hypothetical protein
VQADADRLGSGWSSFEWRHKAALASHGAASSRPSSRGRFGKKRSRMAKELEAVAKEMKVWLAEPLAADEPEGPRPGERTLTYCNTCLREIAQNVQNRRLVAEILRFRSGGEAGEPPA